MRFLDISLLLYLELFLLLIVGYLGNLVNSGQIFYSQNSSVFTTSTMTYLKFWSVVKCLTNTKD